MKILITCFDPFGNMDVNASKEVVSALDEKRFNAEIRKLEIATVRYDSLNKIKEEIELFHPDYIISLGQAGGRPDITFERVGINIDDFRIKDNKGNQPQDEPMFLDGPDAYFTALPIRAMVNALNAKGIKASISNTAGTFVCNHVLYGTRYLCMHYYPNIKSGFIHVPFIKGQGEPYMELNDIVEGISIAIETLISLDSK